MCFLFFTTYASNRQCGLYLEHAADGSQIFLADLTGWRTYLSSVADVRGTINVRRSMTEKLQNTRVLVQRERVLAMSLALLYVTYFVCVLTA